MRWQRLTAKLGQTESCMELKIFSATFFSQPATLERPLRDLNFSADSTVL
jgi:hypothetical protein